MSEEIKYNMPFEDYLNAEGVSASTLSGYARSAMHGRYWELNPSGSTKSQQFGTLIHAMLLEPAKFESQYVLLSESPRRGSKEWKELEEAHPGKILIKAVEDGEPQAELLDALRDKWNSNPDIQKIMEGAHTEVSCFWVDHEYREKCKARPDVWTESLRILADLKSTQNASYGAFQYQIKELGYFRKAAWYMDCMAALGHKIDEFVFIAIETKLPCAVACYCLDPMSIELGRKEMRELLKLYRTCKIIQEWPGYPSLTDIGLAPWAKKELEAKYGSLSGN